MSGMDFSQIPQYKKTKKQLDEIVPLLKTNFLTKNLQDEEIHKIAGAMKIEKFLKKDKIITFGDEGLTYYILSKGNVKVSVYKPGTDPKNPDLEKFCMFSKYMG